jgi:hypothetical protein
MLLEMNAAWDKSGKSLELYIFLKTSFGLFQKKFFLKHLTKILASVYMQWMKG